MEDAKTLESVEGWRSGSVISNCQLLFLLLLVGSKARNLEASAILSSDIEIFKSHRIGAPSWGPFFCVLMI